MWGVAGFQRGIVVVSRSLRNETPKKVKALYAKTKATLGIPKYHGKRSFCGKLVEPSTKAKYSNRPIVNQYREGKVKSPRKRV